VVHLSKTPEGQDVRQYDGSGEWVKIYTLGLEIRPEREGPVYWLPINDYQGSPRVSFVPASSCFLKEKGRVDI